MEMIIVIVVIAMLAAIAIPSFVAFIRHGQQLNRENVARTLYVAMQGQLSRAMVEGNLMQVLTEEFYTRHPDTGAIVHETDNPGVPDLSSMESFRVASDTNLGLTLFPNDPDAGKGNEANVFYISKPRGFTPYTNPTIPEHIVQNKFYRLLDEIIVNKEILSGAILMEFNVRTGVVLSIFYGDLISNQENFFYGGGPQAPFDNISGGRGMETGGYTEAYERRQGYFGVTNTNEAPPLPIEDVVRIFDGMNYSGKVTDTELGLEDIFGNKKQNILFAEYFIQDGLTPAHEFEIYADGAPSAPPLITISNPLSNMANDLYDINQPGVSGLKHPIYQAPAGDDNVQLVEYGINVAGAFSRYIWVLDFVDEDIIDGRFCSFLFERYSGAINNPTNLRARLVKPDGSNINSIMLANSHFLEELSSASNSYEITSVRHLNNISNVDFSDETNIFNFVQTDHIDVSTLTSNNPSADSEFYNFRPIDFLGANSTYTAANVERIGTTNYNAQWRIENLVICTVNIFSGNTPLPDDNTGGVGLFREVQGEIIGVSIFNGTIYAPNSPNVGAIAGILNGVARTGNPANGRIVRSNSFANVTGGSTSTSNTGGLIGHTRNGGVLAHSFNAGFFNSHEETATPKINVAGNVLPTDHVNFGSVTGLGGNIGGLVGWNEQGSIVQCFNNARVNIDDIEYNDLSDKWSVILTESPPPAANTSLGGITGRQSSTNSIINSYATNFVALYESVSSITSGGINGNDNYPVGSIYNSYYILNGAANGYTEGERSRRDFREPSPTLPLLSPAPSGPTLPAGTQCVGFSIFDQYRNNYGEGLLMNLYTQYPYPILSNNDPFEVIARDFASDIVSNWGWEDILDEELEPVVVYYELYDDNTWGFSPESVQLPLPALIPEGNQARTVINDGYAVELQYYGAGYTLILGGNNASARRVFNVEMDINAANCFIVTEPSASTGTTDLVWSGAQFNSADGDMYRLYIPNHILESVAINLAAQNISNTHLTINRGIDNADDTSHLLDTELLNPFFAPLNSGYIRSPRHIHNIGKGRIGNVAALDFSGFVQRLNMDFDNYFTELTPNPSARIDSKLTFEGIAVVSGNFTGTYAGTNQTGATSARYIDNLTISGTGNNVALFERNSGTISRLYMRNLTITGGTNVAAVAAVNDTGGIISGVNLSIRPGSAANVSNIITGTNLVGGIAGTNRGTIGASGTSHLGISYTVVNAGNGNINLNNVRVTATASSDSRGGGITGHNNDGTITDSTLTQLTVLSTQRAGGITGFNEGGTIRRSFVGQRQGGSPMNRVNGSLSIGGISGCMVGGVIEICYVEFTDIGTPVGQSTAAQNVGGLIGCMEGGTLRNAFFDFANGGPQTSGWVSPIRGLTARTGSLIGLIEADTVAKACTISNVYSTAFMSNSNSIGHLFGTGSGTFMANATVTNANFLSDTNYNTGSFLPNVGTRRNTAAMRDVARVTEMNNATTAGTWAQGTQANLPALQLSTAYIYPRLVALQEPMYWPHIITQVYRLMYYEVYQNVNPKTGDTYGLWSSESDDTLDYSENQVVLEDGYLIHTTRNSLNSIRLGVRAFNGTNGWTEIYNGNMTQPYAVSLGGTTYQIIPISQLQTWARHSSNEGLYPLRITIAETGNGNPGNADNNFDGYLNPLFAKSQVHYSLVQSLSNHFFRREFFDNYSYSIRTPRQLNNIGTDSSTLRGNYIQDIDIDFINLNTLNGYWTARKTTDSFINVSKSVISNTTISPTNSQSSATTLNNLTFIGTYTGVSKSHEYQDGERVRAIKNLNIPNPTPTSTNGAQPGNVSIFPAIGTGTANVYVNGSPATRSYTGQVTDLILQNNSISGTTGNVAGLAGVNSGIIRNISVINNRINATTGNAAGIAAVNTGVISDILFVSNLYTSPITGANAGGIVVSNDTGTIANSGTISNTLYIARAPGINPIAATNSATGTIANTNYYLSGTWSLNNRPTDPAILADVPYNPIDTTLAAFAGGTPMSSYQLNSMSVSGSPWSNSWISATPPQAPTTIVNTTTYPYPYLHNRMPVAWPVAASQGSQIIYFEDYFMGQGVPTERRFHGGPATASMPAAFLALPLKDDEPIVATGYAVIVPGPGTYMVKQGADGVNLPVTTQPPLDSDNYYIIIPPQIPTPSNARATEIFVNDSPLTTDYRFVKTQFAKAIFNEVPVTDARVDFYIRTPRQFMNIGTFNLISSATDVFTQERDMDIITDDSYSTGTTAQANGASYVIGNFIGTYDGGGFIISNVAINAALPTNNDSVGLFSRNNGIIKNLVVALYDTQIITATTATQNIGTIAGINGINPDDTPNDNATISDVVVIGTTLNTMHDTVLPPVAITGTATPNIGGIVGSNAGQLKRIMYLAPAPVDGTNIYPIVGENDTSVSDSNFSEVYYLAASTNAGNIGIVSASGTIAIPANGFNYSGTTAPGISTFTDIKARSTQEATSGNTISGTINPLIGASSPWPAYNTTTEPFGWEQSSYPTSPFEITTYPYPLQAGRDFPQAGATVGDPPLYDSIKQWPIVTANPIDPLLMQLSDLLDCYCEDDDTCDICETDEEDDIDDEDDTDGTDDTGDGITGDGTDGTCDDAGDGDIGDGVTGDGADTGNGSDSDETPQPKDDNCIDCTLPNGDCECDDEGMLLQSDPDSSDEPPVEPQSDMSLLSDSSSGEAEGDAEGSVESYSEETDSNELMVAAGAVSLFGGGYGVTRTKIFKSYMRRRRARAIRKINEYNAKNRSGRRVNRYILQNSNRITPKGGIDDVFKK